MSRPTSLARRHHHLVQPEQGELGRVQLPVVDAAQPQEVEDYGQCYHQDAGKEEIVVVDEREARPGAVCLPDALLLEIPVERSQDWPGDATGSELPRPLPGVAEPSHGAVSPAPPQPPLPERCRKPMVPEWQEPRLVEDGPQRPLHLPVVHQLGRAQAGVVQGEAEALVKDLVHPGRFEALIPADTVRGSISWLPPPAPLSLLQQKPPGKLLTSAGAGQRALSKGHRGSAGSAPPIAGCSTPGERRAGDQSRGTAPTPSRTEE